MSPWIQIPPLPQHVTKTAPTWVVDRGPLSSWCPGAPRWTGARVGIGCSAAKFGPASNPAVQGPPPTGRAIVRYVRRAAALAPDAAVDSQGAGGKRWQESAYVFANGLRGGSGSLSAALSQLAGGQKCAFYKLFP